MAEPANHWNLRRVGPTFQIRGGFEDWVRVRLDWACRVRDEPGRAVVERRPLDAARVVDRVDLFVEVRDVARAREVGRLRAITDPRPVL